MIELVSSEYAGGARDVGGGGALISVQENLVYRRTSETACLKDLGENKGIWKEDTECHFKVNLIKEGISAGAGMGLPTERDFIYTQQETSG